MSLKETLPQAQLRRGHSVLVCACSSSQENSAEGMEQTPCRICNVLIWLSFNAAQSKGV